MDWNAVADWAEAMGEKLEKQRRERVKLAAKHFGMDPLDILGDRELEERLMARYEEAGLEWPSMEDDDGF